jgi:hypothetical protein
MFWKCGAATPGKERVLPTGYLELIVDRAHDNSMPMVCGAMSQAFVIDTIPAAVRVRFKPAGALPFLDAPAGELRDVELPLSKRRSWMRAAGGVPNVHVHGHFRLAATTRVR